MKYPVWFSVEKAAAPKETVEAVEAVGRLISPLLYPSICIEFSLLSINFVHMRKWIHTQWSNKIVNGFTICFKFIFAFDKFCLSEKVLSSIYITFDDCSIFSLQYFKFRFLEKHILCWSYKFGFFNFLIKHNVKEDINIKMNNALHVVL